MVKKILKWIGIVLGVILVLLILGAGVLYFRGQSKFSQTYQIRVEPVAIPSDAASIERGKHLVTVMCTGCHGIPGYKTVYPHVYQVPMITGQQPIYMVNALQAYKSGARSHPSMRGVAQSLSDQDMADLAAYYSSEHP